MSNQNNVFDFEKKPRKKTFVAKKSPKKAASWRLRGYLQLAAGLVVLAYFMQLCRR